MTPMQQMLLGVGAKKKVYMDDVFSTFLYEGKGDNTTNSVTNNVDLTKGGMVWTKGRDITYGHIIYDSLRGQNYLTPNENYAQATDSRSNIAFNSTGYTFGDASSTSWGPLNEGNKNFASWSFRKAPGFFDVVTWTGDNSGERNISHNLGSNLGMIMAKRTDASASWHVWHRDLPNLHSILELNNNSAVNTGSDAWGYPTQGGGPVFTSSSFSVDNRLNDNNATYVAYLFAGGASVASTARSVHFNGGQYLETSSSDWNNYAVGTGDFCYEMWIKPEAYSSSVGPLSHTSNTGIKFKFNTAGSPKFEVIHGYSTVLLETSLTKVPLKQWTHIAFTRSSGTIRLFLNGKLQQKTSNNSDLSLGSNEQLYLAYVSGYYQGKISNFRLVIGSAVYTSSFKPPYEPLTNITNTKLLGCQNSTYNGATVGSFNGGTGGTANTDSPFDDPSGYVFGESGTENVIKAGSWVGNGSSGLEVNVGFEPQFIFLKCSSDGEHWRIYDSMRGIFTGSEDPYLYPNRNWNENSSQEGIEVTSTGFKLMSTDGALNQNGRDYIYICIRRPDGYVAKPIEDATKCFALDTGNSSSTIPAMDSGFPVDMALYRQPAISEHWSLGNRLMGYKYVVTSQSSAQSSYGDVVWDSNVGFLRSYNSNYQAWMWKRHAGFDVVAYKGGGVLSLPHNLSKTPEMIWIKCRSQSNENWYVYHKGLNGGNNPHAYMVRLNLNNAEASSSDFFNTPPTSTHVTIASGVNNRTNASGHDYIMILFASISGVSAVGSFTGNGSSAGPTITTGFSPRFILLKNASSSSTDWVVLDTLRDLSSSADEKVLYLNSNTYQSTQGCMNISSTGFSLADGNSRFNGNGDTMLYYAHA